MSGFNTTGEYKVSQGTDGLRSTALVGLSNRIQLSRISYLDLAIQNESATAGDKSQDFTSFAEGLSIKPKGWLLSQRFEYRTHKTGGDKILFTGGVSTNLGQGLSLMMKEQLELIASADNDLSEWAKSNNRLMFGFALRPLSSDIFNMLGRLEHKAEIVRLTEPWIFSEKLIFSLEGIFAPKSFELSFRYAGKNNVSHFQSFDSTSMERFDSDKVTAYTDLWLGRLRIEFSRRFDVAFETRVLTQHNTADSRYDFSPELGFIIYRNIRLGLGYNIFGYNDADLSGAKAWSRGPFIGLDVKFSERGLGEIKPYKDANTNESNVQQFRGEDE